MVQEARRAGLMAKLESVKNRNELRQAHQISQQKYKLAELKLEMKIQQIKAEQAVLVKYEHKSTRLAPNSDHSDHSTQSVATTSHKPHTTLRNEPDPIEGKHPNDLFRRMQLPRMTMETFNGDGMKYSSFLRQFENNIVSKTSDEEERLYYIFGTTNDWETQGRRILYSWGGFSPPTSWSAPQHVRQPPQHCKIWKNKRRLSLTRLNGTISSQ